MVPAKDRQLRKSTNREPGQPGFFLTEIANQMESNHTNSIFHLLHV